MVTVWVQTDRLVRPYTKLGVKQYTCRRRWGASMKPAEHCIGGEGVRRAWSSRQRCLACYCKAQLGQLILGYPQTPSVGLTGLIPLKGKNMGVRP